MPVAESTAPTDARVTLQDVLMRRQNQPGALLPILHDLQDAIGFVPKDFVPEIANALNLSRAEVHGVVTYYHHFRDAPPARHVVQICRAEACQSMGAEALLAHAKKSLACDAHGTSTDGQFTVEPTYCLGLCASSPSMMLGDELHARVSLQRFDALVAEARAAA